ncbi:hypothetical protein [Hymenobacter nivis]|uniref:STAS/SEC14 domain-containing protein n=1 Tax=Hymenobacter nivis TaxID=1850093 RepID=A0A502GWM9_9BACT|nr:hypothetical protein [Hymenobacter nivis]TPG66391.1 hypothetical protein EAH73_08225 [Hymenobacter nivis]
MPYSLLLSWPFVTIAHDVPRGWLYVDWQGPQTRDTVARGTAQVQYFLRATGCCKLLNDNTNVEGTWSLENTSWVIGELLPGLHAAGLRYMAWVYAAASDSWRSTEMTLALAAAQPTVMAFHDVPAAYAWLVAAGGDGAPGAPAVPAVP